MEFLRVSGPARSPPPGAPADEPAEEEEAEERPDDDHALCPVCGAEVSLADDRCPGCGAEFDPEDEAQEGSGSPDAGPTLGEPPPEPGPESAECPMCGQSAPLTSTRCPHCGAEFEAEDTGEEPAPERPGSGRDAESPAESEGEALCPICESAVSLSEGACPFCGAEFEPEEPGPEVQEAPPAGATPIAVPEDEEVLCPACNRAVGSAVDVCPYCGAQFEADEILLEPVGLGSGVSRGQAEEDSLCPMCGHHVGATVAACPHCGAEFEAEEEPSPLSPETPDMTFARPQDSGPGILRPPTSRIGEGRRGISNGTSAINGVSLVNGFGLVNASGRMNGLGAPRTPDMINGFGASNGGAINGRRYGPRGRQRSFLTRWQLVVVLVVCALALPTLMFTFIDRDESPFTVDGGYDDWEDQAMFTVLSASGSPSTNVVEWAVATYAGYLYLYLETESPMMSSDLVEGFALFIDADGSSETGYDLSGMGAEVLVELQGWNGSVSLSACSVYSHSEDRLDWSGWRPSSAVACTFDGSRLEASARLPVSVNGTSKVLLVSVDENGPGCRSCPSPLEGGLLLVEQIPSADIASDGILERGADVVVSTLRFTCERSGGVVNAVVAELDGIELLGSVGAFSLEPGEERVVELRADTSQLPSGMFVSASVTSDGVQSSFAHVYVQGFAVRAYADAPPEGVLIDGAFADWAGRTVIDSDETPVENPNIDIDEVGTSNDTDRSYFFVSVHGEMCMGTYLPKSCSRPMGAGNGTVVPLRKTAEDFMRLYVDSDRSSATGHRVSAGQMTIGADRLIVVSGLCREVRETTLSMYVGGAWTEMVAHMDVEIDQARMELGVDAALLGASGEVDLIVFSTDWSKEQDIAFSVSEDPDSRSIVLPGTTVTYPGPVTESLPEFGDVAVPVVLMLVMFVIALRGRRLAGAGPKGREP